jgi:hypothetical protein
VSTHNLFENFFQLAAAALKQTTNLIGLDISGLCPLLSLLAETHFPRLIEVKIPYGPAVTPFLQTNRQHLKAIVIEGPPTPDSLELSSRHFTNVQLPELIAFIGPCNVIPHVIPGSQVQYLTICWEPGCERRLEEIVRGVAQSRNEVLGMDNLVLGWNPGLLSVIAECVPGMERLRIRNICPLTSREMIEVRRFIFFSSFLSVLLTGVFFLDVVLFIIPRRWITQISPASYARYHPTLQPL